MALFDFFKGGSDQDRFAKAVMARLKAGGLGAKAIYDPAANTLKIGEDTTIYLQNGLLAWARGDAAERERTVAATAGVVLNRQEDLTFEQAAPRLLPAIRNRLHLDPLLAGPPVAFRPFVGPLSVIVVIDSEHGMALVSEAQLAEWSTSFDAALAIATENLRAISPSRFERQQEGFWFSRYGDYHDVARLLLPEVFSQIGVDGDPVVIAAERSAVAVAGSHDLPALKAMASFIEDELMGLDRPIAYTPLVLSGGAWALFFPEGDDLQGVARLHKHQALWDYAEQKGALDEQLAAAGEDIFVASLQGSRAKEGETLDTFAAWTHGVDTLLPRADYVALVGPDRSARFRAWDDVARIFDLAAARTDHYPERYRLKDLPGTVWDALAEAPHPTWANS